MLRVSDDNVALNISVSSLYGKDCCLVTETRNAMVDILLVG